MLREERRGCAPPSAEKDSRPRKNSRAHTSPVRFASTASRATGRCSSQPVVPTTEFTPAAASRRIFTGAATGVENSTATSTPRSVSRVKPSAARIVRRCRISRALRNRIRAQAARSACPSFRTRRCEALAHAASAAPVSKKLRHHARVNLHRFRQFFFRDALFRGVRQMNAARADQKRLAPGSVERRNVGGEGDDGGGKAVERRQDASRACAKLRGLPRGPQRRPATASRSSAGSPTVRNMISACASSATTLGARPPEIVPTFSVLGPSSGILRQRNRANVLQHIEQRVNRGVAQLRIRGVRQFSLRGDFEAQRSL